MNNFYRVIFNKKNNKPINRRKGQAVLTAVIFLLFISTAIAFGSFSFVARDVVSANINVNSKQSYFTAESGVEDMLYRSLSGMNYDNEEIIELGGFYATTTFVDYPLEDRAEIFSEGLAKEAVRKILVEVQESVGAVFNYATQVGDLGVEMYSNSVIRGNVFSNANITGYGNSRIEGDAFAVGVVSSPDPTITGQISEGESPAAMPSIDIEYWKAEANINNDPIIGNVEYNSGSHSLGPRKIEGDLALNSNARLTVTGPLHITGNFSMNSNTHLYLDNGFGSDSTVILVDGSISFNSNAEVHSTNANPKGYLVLVSTKSGSSAIVLNSNSEIEGILHAINGWIEISSNGEAVSLAGRGVRLNANAELEYDLGLRDRDLLGGPSGGWVVNSWGESD